MSIVTGSIADQLAAMGLKETAQKRLAQVIALLRDDFTGQLILDCRVGGVRQLTKTERFEGNEEPELTTGDGRWRLQ